MENQQRKPANACVMVIFGIAGDLTKRLLFPAICYLGNAGLLNENFNIVGVSKENYNDETFRQELIKHIHEFIKDNDVKQFALKLVNKVFYISGEFDNDKTYSALKNRLNQLAREGASKNYLFYFAAPSNYISVLATELSKAGLLKEERDAFRRIVVEKPFGHDLESAKELNKLLLSMVNEQQIFRIDHFLGKETVQNILAFRFSNGLFEPVWNRLYIDHVQITVSELLGVELRGEYYENAGALRDMVANHLLQMLSLIAMEPPSSFSSENIRTEKSKALKAIQPIHIDSVIRGQYGPGKIRDTNVIGYRSEPKVSTTSITETFVALRLCFNNWRWLNVPFYLRTGKRMTTRKTEIVIQFHEGPSQLFNECEEAISPNLIQIFIQPEEGISLRFNAKVPGPKMTLGKVKMKFKYSDYFGVKPKTGYETILYDCMNGDHLLFNDAEMIETEWRIIQPILDAWAKMAAPKFPNYAAGTRGPKEAQELINKDGRKWIL